jgi:D-lactate dehydrogenase (cytochrome)
MIIKNNQDEIQNYLIDASNFIGECDAVYIPENEVELTELVKSLYKSNTRFTISGAGTGLTGGRVPKGGVVISTEKLNKIIEINTEKEFAIVQAGVYLSDFLNELKSLGYFYPPDPTEKNCFIGGTIANNASGAKTFKYGATRNYVLELNVILPDGDSLHLKRGENFADDNNLTIKTNSGKEIKIEIPQINLPLTKNAAGYFLQPNMDAIDLFIGSEGTLGIITSAKLKILPLPDKIISAVCFFDNEIDAIKFIDEARDISYQSRKIESVEKIDALALEFFDNYSLKFLKDDFTQIPSNANGAVWFEQEANSDIEDNLIEKWLELITKHNSSDELVWFATNEKERKEIEEFRHAISWKVNEYISKNNLRKLGTDVAVPDIEMINFYNFLNETMNHSKLNYVLYGHLGNSHFHLNILPKSENEFLEGKKLYKAICDKAIQLKGTISAEHGVGKIKREFLIDMFGVDIINQMKEIKKKFDPKNLLNIGNIFIDEDL